MSKRKRFFERVEKRWVARFGEPPAIRTDPVLLLRILEEDEARSPVLQPEARAA